jgi:serine phosphatase RsbU (regulator of sigma subunit)
MFLLGIALMEIYFLIRYVNKTNKDLARFLNSIEFSDFSQSFKDNNYGKSFNELYRAFSNIIEKFRKTRSEMEEHVQYLQTVVKHIKIGLISFNQDGQVELMNNAAKDLLNLESLINIKQLSSISSELVNALTAIEAGNKSLVKINIDDRLLQVSIAAAEFKMRGRQYTLVSLQDISSELERERLAKEFEIARDVQEKLLPKENPSIPGYSISAGCFPALEIGGDYYDFINLGNNRLGIVIADVSGKGLPAAFYMTLTKGVFQSYAESSGSPKEVLTKLNSLISRTIDKKSFVTMFYAVLDYNLNKITYARAGHEPAVFLNNKNKDICLLKPGGLGLGLDKGDLFSKTIEECELHLFPGDTLLFYTDGVTDLKNETDSDFGIDRLLSTIKNTADNNSHGLLDNIFQELNLFRNNSSQYDDITLITVRRN